MRRIAYITAFVLLAGAAAGLTLRAQHTVSVVVATRDVRAGVAVQPGDVELRRVHDDGAPNGALSSTEAAVGQYTAWPLTAGEPVLARTLRAQRAGGSAVAGLDLPPGYRAIAVPVQPAAAVGGLLSAGDRVDVFATPTVGRQQAAPTADTTAGGPDTGAGDARLLGHDVLVLELRSDQGQSLDGHAQDAIHGLDVSSLKLGSVVLAIPDSEVAQYAGAVASDTIYLALSVS